MLPAFGLLLLALILCRFPQKIYVELRRYIVRFRVEAGGDGDGGMVGVGVGVAVAVV